MAVWRHGSLQHGSLATPPELMTALHPLPAWSLLSFFIAFHDTAALDAVGGEWGNGAGRSSGA